MANRWITIWKRVRIEMRVMTEGFDSHLIMEPHAAMPTRVDNGKVIEDQRAAQDLDARGMSREPW